MKPDHGYVYWIVCLRIYEIGGPCLDGLDTLVRRTGLNRRRVSDALDVCFRSGKLVRENGGIMNPFAAEVLADAISLREERKRAGQEGGKRSAEIRKQNQQQEASKAQANGEQNPTHLHLHKQDSLFSNENSACEGPKAAKPKKPPSPLEIERKDFFVRGKAILGDGAGGLLNQLLAVKHGNVALARAALEQSSTMDNPRQYIAAIVNGGLNGKAQAASSSKVGFSGIAARIRYGRPADEAADRPPPEDLEPINRR